MLSPGLPWEAALAVMRCCISVLRSKQPCPALRCPSPGGELALRVRGVSPDKGGDCCVSWVRALPGSVRPEPRLPRAAAALRAARLAGVP